MKKYNRIVFVCTGNTCMSPMAAAIMNYMKKDTDISVISRGMVVLFPEPYNPKAVEVLANHNMAMSDDSAVQLSKVDFDNDTLVLTMNEDQKMRIYREFDNAINVYTLHEYIGEDESQTIVDPYGKGMEEYDKCFEGLYSLVSKAADKLFNNI